MCKHAHIFNSSVTWSKKIDKLEKQWHMWFSGLTMTWLLLLLLLPLSSAAAASLLFDTWTGLKYKSHKNVLFKPREYIFKPGDIYFLGITLFWLKIWKNPLKTFRIKPYMYLLEFLFHVGFANTVSSNKTFVRNTYFIFAIGWLVITNFITNFIKNIDANIIQDTRRHVMLNPSLKKYHLRKWETLSVHLSWV